VVVHGRDHKGVAVAHSTLYAYTKYIHVQDEWSIISHCSFLYIAAIVGGQVRSQWLVNSCTVTVFFYVCPLDIADIFIQAGNCFYLKAMFMPVHIPAYLDQGYSKRFE